MCLCFECEGDDLCDMLLGAACCYCCMQMCKGSSNNRQPAQPQPVIIQNQPQPTGPAYPPPGGMPQYYGTPQPQAYPPGAYYPPPPGSYPPPPGAYPPPH